MACIRADKDVSTPYTYSSANGCSSIVQIYTDWANHYLEKAKFKRFIQDLQVDLADGVLLADIIEAVACERVQDINRKPKSASQMMDNINACLNTLVHLGVAIDGLTARDIRDGNLKAILGVFFSLSRHKQHHKQLQQDIPTNVLPLSTPPPPPTSAIRRTDATAAHQARPTPAARQQPNRIPTPSSIPTPQSTPGSSSSSNTLRRSIPTAAGSGDSRLRGPPQPTLSNGAINPGTTGGGGGSRAASACSSRSTSPSGSTSSSLIPQPTSKGQGTAGSIRSPIVSTSKTKSAGGGGVNSLCGGGSSVKSAKTKVQGATGSSNIGVPTIASFNSNLPGKNSMLDKFKFFNSKDKVNKVGGGRAVVSQRTSSSSGFSSARSEKSDSSPTSACSDTKSVSNSSTTSTGATRGSSCGTNPETSEANLKVAASTRAVANRSSLKTESSVNCKAIETKANTEDETPVAAIHPDNPVRESRIANLTAVKAGAEAMGDRCNVGSSENNRHCTLTVGGTQNVTVATSTTSIPKPTAAVKGTTKVLAEEHRKGQQSSTNNSGAGETAQMNKKSLGGLKGGCKKADGCSQVDIHQLMAEGMGGGGGGSQPGTPLLRTCRTPSERGRHDTAIAMVSPMPCDPETGTADSIMLPLKGGNVESVPNVNSGGGGHVTRSKMETTFDPTDKVTTRETRAERETTFSEDPEDMIGNIKPMQPLIRASPYGYVRHLPSSSPSHASSTSNYCSPRTMVPSVHMPRLGFPGQYNGGGGNCNGSGKGRQTYGGSDCGGGDIGGQMNEVAGGMGGGYVSDGLGSLASDGNMCGGSSSVADELASGYMSEGAVALSPRRPFLNTRFKETMSSARDGKGDRAAEYNLLSQHKLASINLTHHFGLDDNSSIHSSLSDTTAQVNNASLNADYRLNNEAKKEYSSAAQQQELARRCGSLASDKRRSPKCKRKTASNSSKGDGRNDDERRRAARALANEAPSSSRSKGPINNKPLVGSSIMPSPSGARRPNSTCSASSSAGSSSKSGSGRSKKSSLCGVEGDVQDAGGLSPSIPRPGSAASCRSEVNTRSTLERRNGRYAVKMGPESNSESHRYQQGDIHNYGHGSLGRRLPQNSHGSLSRDVTGNINSHSSFSSRSSRPLHSKMVDTGSDICSYTYGETNTHCSSPYSWLGRSPSSLNAAGVGGRSGMMGIGGSLTESESMESLNSNGFSSIHAHIQHARANSLTQACLALHQKNQSITNTSSTVANNNNTSSPHLARSNSIRSTKSEKMYPSMLRRTDDIDDVAESPGQSLLGDGHRATCRRSGIIGNGTSYPLSLLNGGGSHSTNSSPCHGPSRGSANVPSFVGGMLFKLSPNSKDDEDVHGSQLSLASVASSLYSSPEEKQNHEIRKLRRELADAHDKVHTLTTQLNTNAHVVAAFEQSLANMTNRLQTLTQTAERKDSELNELRGTIESLKKHSADAGLISANYSLSLPASPSCNGHYHSNQRNRSRTSTEGNELGNETHLSMNRQLSTDSMSSVNSVSSTCSGASHRSSDTCSSSVKKKNKIGWLRSSFSKAFSRSRKNRHGSVSDVEDSPHHMLSDTSVPSSPLLGCPPKGTISNPTSPTNLKPIHSSLALKELKGDAKHDSKPPQHPEVVIELKKQLREKEMVLTDVRLEALSSAHQLESLKETVNRMRSEMVNLKQDNERLQRLVTTKSLTSSQSSLPTTDPSISETPYQRHRLSTSEMSAPANNDCLVTEGTNAIEDGKRVIVSVFVGRSGSEEDAKGIASSTVEKANLPSNEVIIGVIYVSGMTRWEALDAMVRKKFNDYVLRVDPAHNLGLNSESINGYSVGEIVISKEFVKPELLPCGYLVGDNTSIKLCLKGTEQNSVDLLAFDALIPKLNAHRLVSLLNEHRRIILSGPSGTGKTFLAHKLAEFLVLRSGKQLLPGSVATFQVDHRSAKELRQYLSNVAEQCEGSNASDLPSVIILDNLHHVGSLGEVFNGFLSAKYHKCPYIIGTMNHGTCSTTNLQLHHNFRWVLCHTHMEPVIGFLGRYLRRKLIEMEVRSNQKNEDLVKVIDWIPIVWQQLNKFLETHSSSDVTIGHRLFLSCPIDMAASQVWFTDLWNYSVVPYLLEAVREGLQVYGRRAPWEDPTEWVIESYPWLSSGPTSIDWPSLLRMRPEDVGYEGHPGPGGLVAKSLGSVSSELEDDPLLNMLRRLQEATSYSSPHSNDSDSVDSHESSSVHTEENSSVSSCASSKGVE